MQELKLAKKKNLWIDAGILPSHIGFESAVSKDCWTLQEVYLQITHLILKRRKTHLYHQIIVNGY